MTKYRFVQNHDRIGYYIRRKTLETAIGITEWERRERGTEEYLKVWDVPERKVAGRETPLNAEIRYEHGTIETPYVTVKLPEKEMTRLKENVMDRGDLRKSGRTHDPGREEQREDVSGTGEDLLQSLERDYDVANNPWTS
jgi:hypothetical protein